MSNKQKKLIVFDMDDVLWNLNDKVAKTVGVDPCKLTTFSAAINPNLTNNERQAILAAYQDIHTFKDIVFNKKIIDLVNQIHKRKDCMVKIISNNVSHEIADVKLQQLLTVVNLPKKDIVLHIITMKDSTRKKLPSNIHIFIDDSPHNILASGAKHCIMPAKT